jgi:hypothetical protein
MNPLAQITEWWHSDPKAKSKLILWFVTAAILFSLFALFTGLNNTSGTTATVSNTTTTGQNTPQVTSKSFDEAGILEKYDVELVGNSSPVLFTPQGRVVFLDKENKLRLNGQTVKNSKSFFGRQLANYPGGVIINQDITTTLYNQSGEFIDLPNKFSWLSTMQSDSVTTYYAIKTVGNSFTLTQNTTGDFTETGFKDVTQVTPSINSEIIETRVLNNQLYVVAYQSFSRNGGVEIWQLTPEKTLKKVQDLAEVRSLQFGKNSVLYTSVSNKPTDLTLYQNTIINFNSNPSGEAKILPIADNLGQNNVLGTVAASRCTFSNDDSVLCLAKDQKINLSSSEYKDSLVSYNFTKNSLSLPYKGYTFAADNVMMSPRGDVFIIGQGNRFLYRITQ